MSQPFLEPASDVADLLRRLEEWADDLTHVTSPGEARLHYAALLREARARIAQLAHLTDGDVPEPLFQHTSRWLESNQKRGDEVRWGRFPLGMVQRWIERAEQAEARVQTMREEKALITVAMQHARAEAEAARAKCAADLEAILHEQ